MINISIVIVTYNSAKDILACLQSILLQRDISVELLIIDNASTDKTCSLISSCLTGAEEKIPNTTLIKNDTNVGFAKAVNQAAAFARGKYLYLLNPDACLTKSTNLKQLFDYANAHPECGVIGSKVVDERNQVAKPQYTYPSESHVSFDSSQLPGTIAWVVGASMLINRDVFQQLKGLDAEFFLYGEEVDFCLRLRQLGLAVGYDADVTIRHVGSGSADQLSSYNKKILKTKGRYQFCKKHYASEEFQTLLERDYKRANRRYQLAKIVGIVFPWLKNKAPVYQAVKDVAVSYK